MMMFRTLYRFLSALAVLIFLTQISCTKIVRERDLFAPQHYPSMADSLQRQNVEIPINKLMVLRGWYLPSSDYHRSLIYFYGNGESVVTVSPVLYWLSSTFKMNVLAVDYRGYGFSDGKPGLEAMSSDALRVYDYLINNLGQEGAPIVIYG
ncbi:MAG: hypothetical protein KAR20_09540, partial [Candidatus Heimdallarchaeota archaeon]|nr:hypothetical protein [Candidatus Heimdallarchaeota archaeon]